MDVFRKHQIAIARKTLAMSDVGAMLMGGMTKLEARRILGIPEQAAAGQLDKPEDDGPDKA